MDTQLNLAALAFAAGAGLLSFASPCVLPLLPAYLSYITGLSAEQLTAPQGPARRARVLAHSIAFVAGLSIVFTLFGASATTVGRLLLRNLDLLTKLAGLLVIVFGLHMVGLVRIPLLYQERRVDSFDRLRTSFSPRFGQAVAGQRTRSLIGALLMGAAFAAGWTPCVG